MELIKQIIKMTGKLVAAYFDDLLIIASGVCFVTATKMYFGLAGAIAVAGVCLAFYAYVVAKSKKGG